MQRKRHASSVPLGVSGAYFGFMALCALLVLGCQDPDPPCDVYSERGYWNRIPDDIGFSHEEVLTLDTVRALSESLDQRNASLGSTCRVPYDFIAFASEGAYEVDLPRQADAATTCAGFAGLIRRFRADNPGALDDVYTTGAPACAVNYRPYLRDVAYCTGSADLDASALSCTGTSRLCAEPADGADTCLECEGELSYDGLSDECSAVLSTRATLTARCPDRVVTDPTDPQDLVAGYQVRLLIGALEKLPAMLDRTMLPIEDLEQMQRDLPRTLRRSRVRACREPAEATLEAAIAGLNANIVTIRGVLDALEGSD